MELSNETLTVFKIIYCEYKRRRSVGFTKSDSINFKDGEIYQIAAFKNRLRPDIDYAVHELVTVKYLKENILGDIQLTEAGIAYMQSKPRQFFEDLSKLFDLASIFI